MSPSTVSKLEKRLQSLGRQIDEERRRLKREALRPAGAESVESMLAAPVDSGDLSRNETNEKCAVTLIENEETLLEEINAALARIGRGVFGECERCGQSISHERLEAIPYARYCIECARAIEQRT